jgi:Na+-transporting methylmalonyl-CoA/oxaloacetate decarboxylase gamma subunit
MDLTESEADSTTEEDKFNVFSDDPKEEENVGLEDALEEGAVDSLNEEIKAVVTEEQVEDSDDVDNQETLDEHLTENGQGQNQDAPINSEDPPTDVLSFNNQTEAAIESFLQLPKKDRELIYKYGVENIFTQTAKEREIIKAALPNIIKKKAGILKDCEKIYNALKKKFDDNDRSAMINKDISSFKKSFEREFDEFIDKIKETRVGFTKKNFTITIAEIKTMLAIKEILSILGMIFTGGFLFILCIAIYFMDEDRNKGLKLSEKMKREIRENSKFPIKVIVRQSGRYSKDDNYGKFDIKIKFLMNFNPLKKNNKDIYGDENFILSQESFNGLKRYFNKIKYSNNNIGKMLFPISPNKIDDLKIPTSRELSNVFVKGNENLKDYVIARFDAAEPFVQKEGDEALTSKFDLYKKISLEAFDLALLKRDKLWKAGLTPYGIIDKNNPLHLLVGKKMAKACVNGIESLENDDEDNEEEEASQETLVNRIFNVAALKHKYNRTLNQDLLEKIKGLEGEFYEDIAWLPEDQKDSIVKVMEFVETDIDPQTLEKSEFLQNVKLAVTDTTVRTELATNTEEDLYNKAKEKVQSFLVRELTADEETLIRAICSNQDSVDTIPSIFEKFIVKLGKEEINDNSGELGEEDFSRIKNKAKAFSTMYTFVNKLDILNSQALEEFNDYIIGKIII